MYFLWLPSKESTKESSPLSRKFGIKNQRHSLNFGNSSLCSSDSPKFFTLIPRFSIHKFHDAGKKDGKKIGMIRT